MQEHEHERTGVLYKILVKRLDGRLFTYTVTKYKLTDEGLFVQFQDRTGEVFRIPIMNTEIRVQGVGENGGD